MPPYWPTGPEAAVHGWAAPDWASGSAGCSPSQPRAWTIPRLWHALGRPQLSLHTLHRRVRAVAAWRRPRLIAKGDPDRDQILADLQQQIRLLPDGAVVLAEDETHINLLPWVRATWIPRGTRQKVMTPGKNRRRTIFGAVDLRTGRFLCQVTHKAISVSFTAFCEQLLAAYPAAPLVAVVCDNVIIHHSKIVQRWLATHPRIQVLHGARYSPHDNPVERIWGTLKAWLANNPHPDHPGPRPPSARLLSPAHPRAAAGDRRAAQLPLAARGLRAELQGGRLYRSLMRIFVLVRGVLVVVGEQGALGWGADLPVVPDRGVEGEQALHDAGPQAGGHAAAVVFQAELVLQRPDDRLHALAQPVGEDPRVVLVADRTR